VFRYGFSSYAKSRWRAAWLVASVLIACLLSGCEGVGETFSGELAYEHVLAQCEIGPRYPGSPGSGETVKFILAELDSAGLTAETESFVYGGVTLRNVVAKCGSAEKPVVLLGAHFDTRRFADWDAVDPRAPVPGGNDGASGVAVLLELARCLDCSSMQSQVWFVFFDGEDQGNIGGWPWSVGAERFANDLQTMPDQAIIVDMIGDADQDMYYEYNSDSALQEHIWGIAAGLGYSDWFIPLYRHTIIDDHLPFARRGSRSVDIIDFDYAFWHTQEDTADKVSPLSLERVGRVLEVLLEERPFEEESD
jgi:glutaminyl-peptide cyclotransferase